MEFLRNLKPGPRLALLTAVFAAVTVLSGWRTFLTLQYKVAGPVYSQIVRSKDLLADVLPPPANIIESCLAALVEQSAAAAVGMRTRAEGLLREVGNLTLPAA